MHARRSSNPLKFGLGSAELALRSFGRSTTFLCLGKHQQITAYSIWSATKLVAVL